ncbi:MAG: hypothetical protein KIIPBIDF_00848 [Candidatus Methanoperedenaceae archaeon GB50]|nr:MAG: hypothetical protein KIIPBIDF_00848 [Candidatus Methanoperedenaceae archaeon GB50]
MDNREEKTDENSHSLEKDETQTLTTLYNESVKNLQPGEILEGKIVCIMKDHVMVDVGFKSEGLFLLLNLRIGREMFQLRKEIMWKCYLRA